MRALLVLAVLVTALAGCSDDGGGPSDTTTPGPTTTTTGTGTGGMGGGGMGGGNGSAGGAAQTWYLHVEGTCEDPSYYLDMNDTDGDVDGCGYVGTGTMWELAAREPAAGGSGAAGTTYLLSNGPSYFEVVHILLADGTEIGRSEIQGGALTGLGYAAIEWSLEGEVPAGATLTLQVDLLGAPTAFLGTEGDHASRFTVG